MYLTTLAKRLLSNNEHQLVSEFRPQLEWMTAVIPDLSRIDSNEKVTGTTLRQILAYDKSYGHTPTIEATDDWAFASPEGEPLDEAERAVLKDDLKDLRELDDSDPAYKEIKDLDIYVLADKAFQRIRGSVVSSFASKFAKISLFKEPYEPMKGTKLYGPDAAMAYLTDRIRNNDFQPIKRPASGPLHLHAEKVGDYLARLAGGTGADSHMPLGYYHIDERVTVDKLDGGFVGIIGEAKRGKTTLLNSIIYNWVMAGKNVLYVSLEHGFENLGATFVIMHSEKVATELGEDYRLPSLEDFKARLADDKDRAAAESIWGGIKCRSYFPGILDIQSIRSWEGIKSHLLTNDCRWNYDALVVDYLRRLDLPTKPGERDAAMAAIIHDAQSLSRTFMGRGLVILTPIEVNREASREASESGVEAELEKRWSVNSIRQDTAFQYTLDLCLGVWSDDNMKEESKLEVEGVFTRAGKPPLRKLMYLDERTKYIDYHPITKARYKREEPPVPEWARQKSEQTTEHVDDLWEDKEQINSR
jgi:hypothetical protein